MSVKGRPLVNMCANWSSLPLTIPILQKCFLSHVNDDLCLFLCLENLLWIELFWLCYLLQVLNNYKTYGWIICPFFLETKKLEKDSYVLRKYRLHEVKTSCVMAASYRYKMMMCMMSITWTEICLTITLKI